MHVADELLRDGAGSAHAAADESVLQRTNHADDIDAVVLVKPMIFDRNEGLGDVVGERGQRHARTHLAPDLADQRSVAPVHERRLRHVDDAPGLAGGYVLGRGRRSGMRAWGGIRVRDRRGRRRVLCRLPGALSGDAEARGEQQDQRHGRSNEREPEPARLMPTRAVRSRA